MKFSMIEIVLFVGDVIERVTGVPGRHRAPGRGRRGYRGTAHRGTLYSVAYVLNASKLSMSFNTTTGMHRIMNATPRATA